MLSTSPGELKLVVGEKYSLSFGYGRRDDFVYLGNIPGGFTGDSSMDGKRVYLFVDSLVRILAFPKLAVKGREGNNIDFDAEGGGYNRFQPGEQGLPATRTLVEMLNSAGIQSDQRF